MSHLNGRHHLSKFQITFNVYDDCGDGKIQACLIGQVARALGLNPTEEEVSKCTAAMKPNDRISFETFMPIYRALARKRRDKTRVSEELIEELRIYDSQETGRIPVGIIRSMLQGVGDALNEEEMEQLLPGSVEEVNYEEFVRMVVDN